MPQCPIKSHFSTQKGEELLISILEKKNTCAAEMRKNVRDNSLRSKETASRNVAEGIPTYSNLHKSWSSNAVEKLNSKEGD